MHIYQNLMKIYENLMKIYSGRMYQTSVRLLIHSTIDVPSGRMYQKWSNVSDFCQTSDTFDYWRCKPSDFWYIRPLTFQVVECIRSYENPWKSMTIHENNRKSDENRMNINERRWKSIKIWWKPMKILWKVVYQTSVRLLIHSTTEVLSGRMYQILWKSMKIYEHQSK